MPAALPIRTDRSPAELRVRARRERDGRVGARLLALANAPDGLPREAAARLAGMTGQTLGDRVHRYNEAGVDGLRDRHRAGRPCGLGEGAQAALRALVLKGPDPARDGLSAWRIRDPCDLAEVRFGRRYSEAGMPRLVKGLDLSRRKPRPVHPRASAREQARVENVWPAPSASGFFGPTLAVCANVSGLGALLPAQMELRAARSS